MTRTWPMAATAAWMAASVGAAALATGEPILRPGVCLSPMMLTLAMTVALAIGWPLLTSSALALTRVVGQGVVVLTIVAVAGERPLASLAVSVISWIAVALLFHGGRRLVARRRSDETTAWAAFLALAVFVAAGVLGGSWFALPLFDT